MQLQINRPMNQFLLHCCINVSNKNNPYFIQKKIYLNFKHIKYNPEQNIENVSYFVTGKILHLYFTSFFTYICVLVLVGTFWRTVKCFKYAFKKQHTVETLLRLVPVW